jgi:threonine/homoserine/homoserine lactone efflux protein
MNATLAFAAAVSVLVAIPGPSVLFTVGRALSVGRRGALLTAVGGTARSLPVRRFAATTRAAGRERRAGHVGVGAGVALSGRKD